MFGPRNSILWVKFDYEDFEHADSVTKSVRIGNFFSYSCLCFVKKTFDRLFLRFIVRRENDTLHFVDDFSEYYVNLNKGTLNMVPYDTE